MARLVGRTREGISEKDVAPLVAAAIADEQTVIDAVDAVVDANPTIAALTPGNGERVIGTGAGPVAVVDKANVRAFGAIGDGASHPLSQRFGTLAEAQAVYPHATALTNEIDWCAIVAAINSIPNGDISVPYGTYLIHTTINVPPQKRLVGDGIRSTCIRANPATFPVDTDLITLGAEVVWAHGAHITGMELDCSSVAGSTGVYSDSAQELSGLSFVRVIKWRKSGVRFLDGCNNYMLHDLELWGHVVTAENQIGMDLVGTWKNSVRNITFDNGYGDPGQKLLAGIRASGQLHADNIHIEDAVDGILLTGTSTHAKMSSITSLDVTNTIRSVAGNLGRWSATQVFRSGGSVTILNQNLGHTLTSGAVASYAQDGGLNSYAVTTTNDSGVPSRFRELQVGDAGTPVKRHVSVRPSVTWPTIAAGGAETQNITVPGAGGGDTVTLGPPTNFPTSLVISRAAVTAVNTVSITVYNPTAGAITPTVSNWRVTVIGY